MPELPAIFARQRRWIFARLVGNGLFQAASLVCSMLLVRHAFDVLLNPAFDDPEVHFYDLNDVWQIGLFAGGLFLSIGVTAWLRLLERVDAERLGQDYVHRVRLSLFDRMGKFAPRSLSRRSTGRQCSVLLVISTPCVVGSVWGWHALLLPWWLRFSPWALWPGLIPGLLLWP